jgi:hypothetical protein
LGDGVLGISRVSQWTGFRGEAGFFIPDLASDGQDSRITLKFGAHAGVLNGLNEQTSAFDYSELLIGARLEQELPASWILRFDFDLGFPATAQSPSFAAWAAEGLRREEAINLVHSALARSFSGMEGALISSHWRAGIGFQPAQDIRVLLDGGQILSALEPSTRAAWWVISPKIEAQITSHAHLMIEGVFAPLMGPVPSSEGPAGDLYLGRIGVQLQWW